MVKQSRPALGARWRGRQPPAFRRLDEQVARRALLRAARRGASFAAASRKLAEILRRNGARDGGERRVDRPRVRRGARRPAGSSVKRALAGRQTFSQTAKSAWSASVTGFAGVARVNPQGKDDAAVIAESLAAVGLLDSLRRRKQRLDRSRHCPSRKIEGRRQAGIAGIAPIGDRAGREPDLEARPDRRPPR